MSAATITPLDLAALHARGENVTLIDVRTPAEFSEVHVTFAHNLPLDRLSPQTLAAELGGHKGPLYLVCRSGARSRQACERLIAGGVPEVVNVEGGTMACEQAGLPVARGKKTISLERQVRIAAGGLVVAGTVLGHFVHPGFYGLSAFVGAGLVFAGVTDTCGMAMVLARMPWNQAPHAGSTTCAVP